MMSISDFSTNFKGGARAYLFEWMPPTSYFKDQDFGKIHVRSTTFPSSNIQEATVEFPSLDFKYAVKRTYEDWTVQFNVDRKGKMRLIFEEWMNKVHSFADGENTFDNIINSVGNYYVDQSFKMLDYDGSKTIIITLYNSWPKSIGAITMDYSSQDVAQFDVTFSYQYHYIR
jgi:hypothetical protein